MRLFTNLLINPKVIARAMGIALAIFACSACSTGIDNTKKITMSGEDKRVAEPSAEELYLADIKGVPLGEWELGKPFHVADSKIAILLSSVSGEYSDTTSMAGKTLLYNGIDEITAPDGTKNAQIVFSLEGDALYSYDTQLPTAKAKATLLSDALPMLIDPSLIDRLAQRMNGNTYWTTTTLWYDPSGNIIPGRRFVPVTIDSVSVGNKVFPVSVAFTDNQGRHGNLFMNLGSSGIDSRAFQYLFSLTDPRLKYPKINDEVWTLICNGKVKTGMTKEECRLSLGNPADAIAGHDFSQTLDFWKYPDGKYLHFQDGLLVDFK